MTKKEKTEYWALAVAVVATAAVLYFFVFSPQTPTPALGAPAQLTSGVGAAGFLPNGTSVKTDVLQNPQFTSLVAPVYPQVTRDEVGSADLFAQPAAPSTSTPVKVGQ